MRQCCLVAVKEVGNGVGSVLGKGFILGTGKVLMLLLNLIQDIQILPIERGSDI